MNAFDRSQELRRLFRTSLAYIAISVGVVVALAVFGVSYYSAFLDSHILYRATLSAVAGVFAGVPLMGIPSIREYAYAKYCKWADARLLRTFSGWGYEFGSDQLVERKVLAEALDQSVDLSTPNNGLDLFSEEPSQSATGE